MQKGHKHSEETKRKMSEKTKTKNFMKGKSGELNPFYGKKHDEFTRNKMSSIATQSYSNGRKSYWAGKKRPEIAKLISTRLKGRKLSDKHKEKLSEIHKGDKHWNWKTNRTDLKKYSDSVKARNCPAYKEWRRLVWSRDNFKCKIADLKCKGRIEAHHILGWTEYPELRYDINNGITLCHAHHPRKRAEEKRLMEVFKNILK